jgi:biotin-dependent carboxylase-like uncharacterized protein
MSSKLATVTIIKSGPGTSVQDLGRKGMAEFGIPTSGAMDQRSLIWINHLLGNQSNVAAIEISQPGFIAQFDSPTQIALAGATAVVKVNQKEIPNPSQISIRAKDILEIGRFTCGARIYLGIKHGFQTEEVLGSRSFSKGVTHRSLLSTGEQVAYLENLDPLPRRNAKVRWSTAWYQTSEINAFPGPDFDLLQPDVREKLLKKPFAVSMLANRMGIQLSELLENTVPELPTNPVFPGTIQLTSGGKLLILLQDAQVTGGYPRILHLDEESRWIMAQKRTGDTLHFKLRE